MTAKEQGLPEARELLAAELDAIGFPSMTAEVRDPEGDNTLGVAMVRVVSRALAALASDTGERGLSVEQGQGWLPIESAPRDGTVVVVFSPADGVNSSHYEGGMWQSLPWRGSRHPDFERAKPTHWQPLPAAPVQPDGVGK